MVGAPRIGRRELAVGAAATAVGTLAGCRRVRPADVAPSIAMDAVRHLAEVVGPRPGTAPAYFRAADWVEKVIFFAAGFGPAAAETARASTPAARRVPGTACLVMLIVRSLP